MMIPLIITGVFPMIIEFTSDIGEAYKANQIVELADDKARTLITMGQAKESDAGSLLRQANKADLDKFKADLLGEIRTALQPANNGRKPAPPGTADFGTVVGSSVPAEEQDKKRSLADALRCVFIVNAQGVDPQLHDWARRRLRGYSDEYTEYAFNEQTGDMSVTTTRSLANGGLEKVTRTGTDSVNGGPTYGFTLKPTYVDTLFRIAREAEVFADGARGIPVNSGNEALWPMLDQFKSPTVLNGIPQSAVFAGITLSYLGEIAPRVSSDGATDMNRFKIADLTGYTTYSRDYIVDNYIAMDAEINRMFGEAMGWIEDWVCIRGDGINKPQGYFNANAAITSGPNSGSRTTSNQIDSADLTWMISKLSTMCWRNARWITNVTTFPYLAILQHNGTPVFQPNAMINQSELFSIMAGSKVDEAKMVSRPMGTLLGFPVYFSEKVPTLGNTGDISLVCPYQYGLAQREGLEVGVSEHFLFNVDEIAFRFKKRHYGRSLWRAPYTQADNLATPSSGTQVSPFIVLHS